MKASYSRQAQERRAKEVAARLERLGGLQAARALIRESGCSERAVLGGDLHKGPAHMRHRIWMMVRHTMVDLSAHDLARVFGVTVHSTVLMGVYKAERELAARYATSGGST